MVALHPNDRVRTMKSIEESIQDGVPCDFDYVSFIRTERFGGFPSFVSRRGPIFVASRNDNDEIALIIRLRRG